MLDPVGQRKSMFHDVFDQPDMKLSGQWCQVRGGVLIDRSNLFDGFIAP